MHKQGGATSHFDALELIKMAEIITRYAKTKLPNCWVKNKNNVLFSSEILKGVNSTLLYEHNSSYYIQHYPTINCCLWICIWLFDHALVAGTIVMLTLC